MHTILILTPLRLAIGAVALAVAIGLGAVAMAAVDAALTATRSTAVDARAAGAPGRVLGMSIVTIPAGVALPKHRHAGTQVAAILSGKLTYTVSVGAVPVYRTSADGTPTLTRTIRPGTTAVLGPGDSIAEEPGDIHRGANRGTVPVRIQLATLFPKGAPSSIAVE